MVSRPLRETSNGETNHVPETRSPRPDTILWLHSTTLSELFQGWPKPSSANTHPSTRRPPFAIPGFVHGDTDLGLLQAHVGDNSRHLFSCCRRSDVVFCFARSADGMTDTVTLLVRQPQRCPSSDFTYMPHPPELETIDLSTCISHSLEQTASVSFVEVPAEPNEDACDAQSESQSSTSDGSVRGRKKKIALPITLRFSRSKKNPQRKDQEEQGTLEAKTPEERAPRPVARAWASLRRGYSNDLQTSQDLGTEPCPQIVQGSDWSGRLSETIGDLLHLSRDTSEFDWSDQGLELDEQQRMDLEDFQSRIADLAIDIIALDHFEEKDT